MLIFTTYIHYDVKYCKVVNNKNKSKRYIEWKVKCCPMLLLGHSCEHGAYRTAFFPDTNLTKFSNITSTVTSLVLVLCLVSNVLYLCRSIINNLGPFLSWRYYCLSVFLYSTFLKHFTVFFLYIIWFPWIFSVSPNFSRFIVSLVSSVSQITSIESGESSSVAYLNINDSN